MRCGTLSLVILAALVSLPIEIQAQVSGRCTIKHDWQNDDPRTGLVSGYHISMRPLTESDRSAQATGVAGEEVDRPVEPNKSQSNLTDVIQGLKALSAKGSCVVDRSTCRIEHGFHISGKIKTPTFSIYIGTYPLYVDHLTNKTAKISGEQIVPVMTLLTEAGLCAQEIFVEKMD
jgi:hypothetical protein